MSTINLLHVIEIRIFFNSSGIPRNLPEFFMTHQPEKTAFEELSLTKGDAKDPTGLAQAGIQVHNRLASTGSPGPKLQRKSAVRTVKRAELAAL